MMESGALGKALAFHGSHINGGTLSWRTVEDVITNSAVHDLHSARWMMGDESRCGSTPATCPTAPAAPTRRA